MIFEINTFEFVRHESLTHTMNFGIGFAFSKGLGSALSESPGPLYKVCKDQLGSNKIHPNKSENTVFLNNLLNLFRTDNRGVYVSEA